MLWPLPHRVSQAGGWIELTTLIIPGLNDADTELHGIALFIKTNLGADTPWHVTQFHPTYKLTDRPRTPLETLRKARAIGHAAGLRYVYEGNVPGEGGEKYVVPNLYKSMLIERYGFTIVSYRISNGTCLDCGTAIVGM